MINFFMAQNWKMEYVHKHSNLWTVKKTNKHKKKQEKHRISITYTRKIQILFEIESTNFWTSVAYELPCPTFS